MRERILLVDDEQAFCLTLKRALERRGYEVETAFDGRTAIARAQATVFDLVVVDVRMPDINGLEALKAVKDVQPRVEGIVMTGYASYEAPVNAIKLGVRDYLGKPFDLDVFIAAIERVLGEVRVATARQRRAQRGRAGVLASLSSVARRLSRVQADAERLAYGAAMALGLGESRARELGGLAWLCCVGPVDDPSAHWLFLQEVLEPVEELRSLLPVLASVHERYDGDGWPDGLCGDEIPLPSRILAAVRHGVDGARRLAGTALDPRVVDHLSDPPPLPPPAPSLDGRFEAMMRLAAACREAGDLATAGQALELALAAAGDDGQRAAACGMAQAWLALQEQAPARALALAGTAVGQAARAGPSVLAHVRVDQGRLLHRLGRREEAEEALLLARQQFERWQWRYQAARTTLYLADLYRGWQDGAALGAVTTLLASGQDDLVLWEWEVAGPVLAQALGAGDGDDAILRILARMGPEVATLWPENEVPPAVRALLGRPPSEEGGPAVQVQCFGDFVVLVGATRIADTAWKGRKARHLLAYLMLHHGRMVPADVLIELFWPETESDKARHTLHTNVHRVRKALEGAASLLVQKGDTYGVSTDLAWHLDVQQFEARFAAGRAAMARGDVAGAETEFVEADRLYRGDLLPGALYEEWSSELRDGYRRKHQDVLLWLSRGCQEAGRLDAAVDYARRLVALDPSREESARQFMTVLAAQGRRDEAVRVYQQFCRVLQEEVGVAPLPETRSVYDQIRQGVAV